MKSPPAGKGSTGSEDNTQNEKPCGLLELNNAVERHGCYKQDIFNMAAQGRAKKQTGCQMFH